MAKKSRAQRNDRHNKTDFNLEILNNRAIKEGPKRKQWSSHDLQHIQPITSNQSNLFQCWFQGSHICAHGSAGTGKTYMAVYLALNEVITNKKHDKIIIIRSAVPTRELGHLPGTLEDKTALYELPYHDICHELVGKKSTYQDMKDVGLIEFMTTSFIRGLTWNNAVIIVEEGENMTSHEIDSVMTRIGVNSRVIFTGDIVQTDLDGRRNGVCGMQRFLNITDNMKEFASIQFTSKDIVRSDFVKSWIIASELADINTN